MRGACGATTFSAWRKKTSGTGGSPTDSTSPEISIPWEPALQEIAERHGREGTSRLFPVVTAKDPREQWRQYDCALHRINYNLKKLGVMMGLGYPLNLTVARHSWESMTKGVSISDLL